MRESWAIRTFDACELYETRKCFLVAQARVFLSAGNSPTLCHSRLLKVKPLIKCKELSRANSPNEESVYLKVRWEKGATVRSLTASPGPHCQHNLHDSHSPNACKGLAQKRYAMMSSHKLALGQPSEWSSARTCRANGSQPPASARPPYARLLCCGVSRLLFVRETVQTVG